jgi:hypothetical protein
MSECLCQRSKPCNSCSRSRRACVSESTGRRGRPHLLQREVAPLTAFDSKLEPRIVLESAVRAPHRLIWREEEGCNRCPDSNRGCVAPTPTTGAARLPLPSHGHSDWVRCVRRTDLELCTNHNRRGWLAGWLVGWTTVCWCHNLAFRMQTCVVRGRCAWIYLDREDVDKHFERHVEGP